MRRALTLVLIAAGGMVGCARELDVESNDGPFAPSAAAAPRRDRTPEVSPDFQAAAEAAVRAFGPRVEATYGSPNVALHAIAWLGHPDQQTMGTVIFFNDRGNQQFGIRWVPGDPFRNGRTNIKYATLPSAPAGLTTSEVDAAIDRAMDTWDGVACSSGLTIDETSFTDPDFDILHAGFVPGLGAGVLASTSIFIWIDVATGQPTDIDNDGNLDYAFAVIQYNADFPWGIDADNDVETVALHESGHGLGQGHFGKAFGTFANLKLHFAPRAVMNATYSGIQQEIAATDNAGHCGLWGSWPSR